MSQSLGKHSRVKWGEGKRSNYPLSRALLIALALVALPPTSAFSQAPIAQERSPAGITFSPATNDLFIAVRRKDLKAVEAAIKAGADIYATNRKGTSAVGLAVDQGFFEIAHFLLRLRGERDKRITQSGLNAKGAWTPKVTLAEPKRSDKDDKPSQVTAETLAPAETPVLADNLVVPLPPRSDSDQPIALTTPPPTVAAPTPQRPFALEPPNEEISALPTETAEAQSLSTETAELPAPSGLPKIDLPDLTGEIPDITNSPEKDEFSIPSIGETLAPETPPSNLNKAEENLGLNPSTNFSEPGTSKVESPAIGATNGSSVISEADEISVEEVRSNEAEDIQTPPAQDRKIAPPSSSSLIEKLRASFSQLTSDLVAGSDAADRKRTSGLVNKFEESFEQFAERYVRERGPSGANEPGAASRLVTEVREAYLRLIQGTSATVITREDTPAKLPNLEKSLRAESEAESTISEVQSEIPSLPPSAPVTNTQAADATSNAKPSQSPVALSRQSALEKMRAKVLNTWRFFTGASTPEEEQVPDQAPVEFVQKRNPVRTPVTSPPITAQTPSLTPESEDEATFVEDPGESFEEALPGSVPELPGKPAFPEIGEPDDAEAITEVPATAPKGTDELAFLPPPEGYEHLAKPGETEEGGESSSQASATSKAPTLEQQLDQAFNIPGIGDEAPKPATKPKTTGLEAQLDEAFSIPTLDTPSNKEAADVPGLPGSNDPATTQQAEATKQSEKYTTVGPGPSGPAPIGVQPKKADGGLIDKLVELVQPDELSSVPDDATPPVDNADETGWGVKKIERVNTPPGQAGTPSGVPQAPGKYMSNVVLTIGESLRLGRTTSDRDGQGANPDTCVIKRRGTVAFCVEPAGWPETLERHFIVDSIMYQGPMAVTRYDDGVATNHHVIFNSKSFGDIVDYYKSRFGDPTSVISRGIAPMGQPRRGNPVAMWQSVDPRTNLVTTLEVRKFDDARGGFPDTDKGVILLYHAWSSPIFPQLSTLELMVLKPQTTTAAGGAPASDSAPSDDLSVPSFPGG